MKDRVYRFINKYSHGDKIESFDSTANISKLGVNGLSKVRTFNKIFNDLTGKWLGTPSPPHIGKPLQARQRRKTENSK